jgi:fructokinase
MPTTIYRLGIDLGGTKTEVIILDSEDREIHRRRVATPRKSGADEYRGILTNLNELITAAIKCVPREADLTIGIGIPGSLDPITGLVRNANTTCLNGKPLKADVEKQFDRPIGMMNDANCFILAECRQGAARGFRVVFGVIMGTGCGGGICIDGMIHHGHNGIGGEWGHFAIDPHGAKCYCGNHGCIETKISGTGVEKAFYQRFNHRLKMEEIVMGYRKKDPSCTEVFLQFLEDFGCAAGGLISILDPDAIILGGGLSNIDELYDSNLNKIRDYAFHPQAATPVLKNELGDSAGVYGAAWIGI